MVYYDRNRPIRPETLKRMSDAIRHRGPDDEGFYNQDNIGLGFRRLSIIDINTGHQPLANANESIYIVFNGEIYNYQEKRELLIQKGYTFNTATDTEVILHLYEEFGTDCLSHLRGMFAFTIWDNNKQQLFCARDRFGIKPFYYYQDNEKFIFGSEIKTILACDDVDRTLSNSALDSYFAFGYVTSDLSIYSNIKKLQPSHFIILSFKGIPTVRTERYWKIEFEPDYCRTENQWKEDIVSCFSETVKLHMISDVPLGAFLSGGIDSSSVVAMMAKNSSIPVKTFSIGFKEQRFNELEFAREVATKYNCEHHEQIVEPESIELLPRLVSVYDEPFADSSAIPTYYVSRLAREYVTVALSGDGGDELFAGYDIYNYFKRVHSFLFNFKNKGINKLIWGGLSGVIPGNGKIQNTLYYLSKDKEVMHAHLYIWPPRERQRLMQYNQTFKHDELISESYRLKILRNGAPKDFISSVQYLDLKSYMVDDILTKVDRASMLSSLEVRVPMLDHKFAELTFRIPSDLKLKDYEQKHILKSAMSPYLSNNILNHQKQGFSVPLAIWFKDDLTNYVKDTLLLGNPRLSSYLNLKYVRKFVEKHYDSKRNSSEMVWSLLFFEEWLNQNKV